MACPPVLGFCGGFLANVFGSAELPGFGVGFGWTGLTGSSECGTGLSGRLSGRLSWVVGLVLCWAR